MTKTWQGLVGQGAVVKAAEGHVKGFAPPPFPPPTIDLSRLALRLQDASLALGNLNGIRQTLPDPDWLVYSYVRKEAVLSAQIEGTQSSLSDLILHEYSGPTSVPIDDVEEASNYVHAMNHGLDRLKNGFPICNRLICDLHKILLSGGRGANKAPGEFRRIQNWIGGTTPANAHFVPPSADKIGDLMAELERFIHEPGPEIPLLIQAGMSHVQFETIHPFLDGNGRMGRLLITLLLCAQGILEVPILYLSLYFKTHRQRYYELLQNVHTSGDWESWLEFFLDGVAETSQQVIDSAAECRSLFDAHREQIASLGRPSASALRVHGLLQERPVLQIADAAKRLGVSKPTVATSLQHLIDLGFVHEATGRSRRRVYVYSEYLSTVSRGTDPLPLPL